MSAGDIDPFAAWCLSLLKLSLPLSIEQQTVLVSLVGVCAIFALLLLLLMLLFGFGSCCEPMCCAPRVEGDGFVVLDEKTDVEAATFRALAKAELVDGTPRFGTSPSQTMYLEQPPTRRAAAPAATPATPAVGFAPAAARSNSRAEKEQPSGRSPHKGTPLPEISPAAHAHVFLRCDELPFYS